MSGGIDKFRDTLPAIRHPAGHFSILSVSCAKEHGT
jgi:hypothetical protein